MGSPQGWGTCFSTLGEKTPHLYMHFLSEVQRKVQADTFWVDISCNIQPQLVAQEWQLLP